jgi:hypothetical protein
VRDERRREPDGTVTSRQSAPVEGALPAERLGELYWEELARLVPGLVRVRPGPELRLLGLVPLLRLVPRGPATYEIAGGLLGASGTLTLALAGGVASVTVAGFRPRLPRALYAIEERVHVALSRRFLARVRREAAAEGDYNGMRVGV